MGMHRPFRATAPRAVAFGLVSFGDATSDRFRMLSRALIVLLLVLNLGIATWWITRAQAVPASGPALPPGVPRLQLLGEVPAPASTVPAIASGPPGAAVPQPESVPAMRCFTFGPFPDDAAAARATAMLAAQGLRSRVRNAPVAPSRGWDVRLPPLPDRAAAQAVADRLGAAGIADYYVLAGGEAANAIALGRYRSETAAQRRQAELQAAGFAATIHPVDAQATTRWVDVATPPAFDPAAARVALGAAQALPAGCGTLG